MDIKEYEMLKSAADRLRKQVDRAAGEMEVHKKALADLGYSTIEEAQAAVLQLEEEIRVEKSRYASLLAEFKSQWGEVLSGN